MTLHIKVYLKTYFGKQCCNVATKPSLFEVKSKNR